MGFYIDSMVVNQVSSNLNTTSSAKFSEFKQPKYGYFIQPEPDTVDINSNSEDKIDKKKLWTRIGIGLFIAGHSSFGLFKVMPKSVIKKFDNFKQFLEKKIEKETTNSKTAIFYRTILKASNSFGEKCQGMNNIISFKDLWFKRKITDRVPVVQKACDTITKWFNSIGRFTVKHSYKGTRGKFGELYETFGNLERELLAKDPSSLITINGTTKTVAEWVKDLAAKRSFVEVKMGENFSTTAVGDRYAQIRKIMGGLEDGVWNASFADKHNFLKQDTYFTFVAEKLLAVDKARLGQSVHKLRGEISYNTQDKVRACESLLMMNKRLFNPKDVTSEKLYRELARELAELKSSGSHSPNFATLRENVLKKIEALNNSISLGKDKYKYDDSILSAVGEHSRIMREILNSSERGTLDEMLDIYKQLLPEKDYLKLKKQVHGTVKALDSSIKTETSDYFDKLRDLQLGSAPTDILTILLGFGSLGVGLASTDDKDTQTAVALKYGIPAIGGMLTSMVITSMLVAGLKSHIVGFASSVVLNRIGSAADKYIKNRNQMLAQQQNSQKQPSSDKKVS